MRLLITANTTHINQAGGDYGFTPLQYAMRKGGNIELAKVLLAAGADANQATVYGYTALHHACFGNDIELIALLINAGAAVNPIDNDGNTPLHHVSGDNTTEAVKLLLAAGADTSLANNDGKTPLQIAQEGESTEVAKLLQEQLDNLASIAHDAKCLL